MALAMINYEEAQRRLLALASPLPAVNLALNKAHGRYLASDVIARRTQPAADLSAMDGYAVRYADLAAGMQIIGESAAGRPFDGTLQPGQAVRIFTGAQVPNDADTILIQEDAAVLDQRLTITGTGPDHMGRHIRKAGSDFNAGEILLSKGQLLNPGAIAVAAMANYSELSIHKSPIISILASGDELVHPGDSINSAQIPSSNSVMLSAILAALPCEVTDHGIAKDDISALQHKLESCEGSDVIVTSGGASVGDHDLVQTALTDMGAEMDFWRVAIRPGKPIMSGKLGNSIVLGLPGNPSSAFVTSVLFLLPLVRYLSGSTEPLPVFFSAPSLQSLPNGGGRTEFIRARVDSDGIRTFGRQDSGLTTPLAVANALLVRPADSKAAKIGDIQKYIYL